MPYRLSRLLLTIDNKQKATCNLKDNLENRNNLKKSSVNGFLPRKHINPCTRTDKKIFFSICTKISTISCKKKKKNIIF